MTLFCIHIEECFTFHPVTEKDKRGFAINIVICGLVLSFQVGW